MNVYYVAGIPVSDELYHHGIQGQKWGIRRYQNPDGTLTPEGKKRYSGGLGAHNLKKDLNKLEQEYAYAKGDQFKALKKKDSKAVKEAIKKQKEIESQTWQLLAAAHNLKYDVLGTTKYRSTVRKGERWIADMPMLLTYPAAMIGGPSVGFMVGAISGAAAGAGQAFYDIYRYGGAENLKTMSNKYKVNKNGTGKIGFA